MALPPGTIVVANPGFDGQNIGLFAVNPANGQVTPLAQGGMFVVPWNVVFLADGRLLVADATAFGTGGLIAVDPDSGQQTKVSSSSLFLQPYGLALAADGQVVVTYTDRPGQARGVVMRVNPANGEHRAVSLDFRFDFPFCRCAGRGRQRHRDRPERCLQWGSEPSDSHRHRPRRLDPRRQSGLRLHRCRGRAHRQPRRHERPDGWDWKPETGALPSHKRTANGLVASRQDPRSAGSHSRGQRRHPGRRPHRSHPSRRSQHGSAKHGHHKRPPPQHARDSSPPINSSSRARLVESETGARRGYRGTTAEAQSQKARILQPLRSSGTCATCDSRTAQARVRRDHPGVGVAPATPPDSAGNGRADPAQTPLRTALCSGCSQSRCADVLPVLSALGCNRKSVAAWVRPVPSSAGWSRSTDRPAGSEPELC